MATHLPDAFDAFPYIALLSPAKRCGKTRVLELLGLLSANALQVASVSPAALFRMMATCPTLLMDEVEPLKAKNVSESSQAIISILNAGHRRSGIVTRCEPPRNEPKSFPVYGPKAFAAIGNLPDTLADRSIRITMQRKTAAQKVERFLFSRSQAAAEPIRELLSAREIRIGIPFVQLMRELKTLDSSRIGMPTCGCPCSLSAQWPRQSRSPS